MIDFCMYDDLWKIIERIFPSARGQIGDEVACYSKPIRAKRDEKRGLQCLHESHCRSPQFRFCVV